MSVDLSKSFDNQSLTGDHRWQMGIMLFVSSILAISVMLIFQIYETVANEAK